MKKYVVAALLSAFLAVPAVRAAPAAPSPAVPTGAGYYAGVKLGAVKNSVDIASEISGAFGVFGGYMVGSDFALQIGYTNLGSLGAGRIKFTALELSAVATFPINEQFSLLGKLGMANTVESGLGQTGTRLAATYGMAGQFNISPTIGIRFGWDHYGFGDRIIWKEGNSNLYSIAGVVLWPALASEPELEVDRGVYVALSLGQISYSNAAVSGDGGVSYENPNSSGITGGYYFSPNLAVEAGYYMFGDSTFNFSDATTTLKTSALQVAAVGIFPINDKFDVFGKLGVASVSAEESGTGAASPLAGSSSTTNLMFGLGGQFNIGQHFAIRAQYEDFGKAKYTPTYFGVPGPASDIGVTAISVGGVYNF